MSVPKYLLGVIAILTVVVSCIPTTPLIPRQESRYQFVRCSAEQQKSIESSLDDMQELARAAIGPSEASNAGQDWYKAWWGTFNSSEVGMKLNEKINTQFEILASFKRRNTGTVFSCDQDQSCCKMGKRYVHVIPFRPIDDI